MCHCLACQKRTGSVFGAQARWPSERVRIEGTSNAWTRTGDEGGRATFHFCPTCGATVHYTIDAMPGMIAIPIGVFEDPRSLPAPRFSVYEARKHPWVSIPEGAERWD
jgi:hypothetical protein